MRGSKTTIGASGSTVGHSRVRAGPDTDANTDASLRRLVGVSQLYTGFPRPGPVALRSATMMSGREAAFGIRLRHVDKPMRP